MKKSDTLLMRQLMKQRKHRKEHARTMLDYDDYPKRVIAHAALNYKKAMHRSEVIEKELKRRSKTDSKLKTIIRKIGVE